MQSVLAGDIETLVGLMSDDIVAYTDGGGVVSATIQPVYEPRRIATVIMHLVGKNMNMADVQFSFEAINGSVALLICEGWGVPLRDDTQRRGR